MMREELKHRILVLDGAMGTEIQKRRLTEADFRGDEFAAHPVELKGNNDILVLTRPDVIAEIHRAYLDAGADIISTCTFNAQAISQKDYSLESHVRRINLAGAQIARREVDRANAADPSRRRFVAGSVGPTTALLNLAVNPDAPYSPAITFGDLENAYIEQISALIEGGVDSLLFETVLDTLNVKAALSAAEKAMTATGRRVEVMVSATVTDSGGRILSGQSIEAFAIAVGHAPLLSIGLNCSLGADGLVGPLGRLSETAPYYVSVHPNAGLPNRFGGYDDTPAVMWAAMKPMLDRSLVNIVGGCCGTGPEHIAMLRRMADTNEAPLRRPEGRPGKGLVISGLEPLASEGRFVNVGERCNVAGSRKFLRLIKEKNFTEALAIARKQVEDGAMVIDINMDDAMLDARAEMSTFLALAGQDPDIAKVPFMVDSSDFSVIEAGLKSIAGKAIVNSISLKEGEEAFLDHARTIRSLGAAVVVMAFDEQGQATTFDRKIEICARAYRLLTEHAGFNPSDIIFDPNILTVATGIEEHLDYAYDFVRATRWIRENLPGAHVSGGLSNLSFAFRGNNPVREAMHAVFLARAVAEGMDMAILNPATAVAVDQIDPELRAAIDDVLFSRRNQTATERLLNIASCLQAATTEAPAAQQEAAAQKSLDDRLRDALIAGDPSHLSDDLTEALSVFESPLKIIAGPLMDGINRVGTLFGEGRMFLPQVVKTARTMKMAVDFLQPHIIASYGATDADSEIHYTGTALLATVKGDVHDIGKNIVGVILSCNGYRIIDLGVMVPQQAIIDAIREHRPDFVCLSGLITPSLAEMCRTVEMMRDAGLCVPVMIGGAATSELHTAVKIAPLYPENAIIHVRDAAVNPVVAARLLDPEQRDTFIAGLHASQAAARAAHADATQPQADPSRRFRIADGYRPAEPPFTGLRRLPMIAVADLIPLIDWSHFYHAWKVKADNPEAVKLRADADALLSRLAADPAMGVEAAQAFYPARPVGDAIEIDGPDGKVTIQTKRQTKSAEPDGTLLALCDFVAPAADHVGIFAATVSQAFTAELDAIKAGSDPYAALLMHTVGDRLVEAASEHIHRLTGLGGIRPAVGYPSFPDQRNIFALARLIPYPAIGITLTSTGAMSPPSSVTGLYLSHPCARYFNT